MAAGFKVRRIKTENSIGDRLKKARTRKKISVAEVEEITKIRAKFILALESDSWELIPSEVYGRGYLERYAEFLHMADLMKQYDRERSMYARTCQDSTVELAPKSRLKLPRFLLTPRFFLAVAIIAAVGGVGAVIGRQILKFTSAPSLELFPVAQARSTSDGTELIVSTNSVNIGGKTAIGASVEMNGVPVTVSPEGTFSGTVSVQKGVNAVVIKASNGKGKETVETLSVTVD